MGVAPPAPERAPRPGRPRSAQADRAILEAALALLARQGYDGMTMEAVAEEAGVGKATVYRRYRDKADLATAAVAMLKAQEPFAVSDDVRADLVAHLQRFRRVVESMGTSMVGTLLLQEERNPALMAQFRARVVLPGREAACTRLRQAQAEGQVDPDADLETALDALVGSYWARHLARGPVGPDWPQEAVAAVWPGLAAR